MNDKCSQIFLRVPFWLNNREIKVIEKALGSHQCMKNLNEKQVHKVAALLFSLSYADKWAERRRTILSKGLRLLITWFMPFKSKTCLPGRKIYKMTGSDVSLPFVIDHLVNHIGLDKPASLIFKEYHAFPHLIDTSKPKAWFNRVNIAEYITDSLEAYQYIFDETNCTGMIHPN